MVETVFHRLATWFLNGFRHLVDWSESVAIVLNTASCAAQSAFLFARGTEFDSGNSIEYPFRKIILKHVSFPVPGFSILFFGLLTSCEIGSGVWWGLMDWVNNFRPSGLRRWRWRRWTTPSLWPPPLPLWSAPDPLWNIEHQVNLGETRIDVDQTQSEIVERRQTLLK